MRSSDPIIFDVPPVFRVESIVGQGAYGGVCKAYYGDDQLAIKKIPSYAKSDDSARRVLRELEILQNLQFCEQVVGCRLFFRPVSNAKDVYVAMDYIPSDLSSVIKNKNIPFDENIVRYITCQLLLAIRALHRCCVLHRDVSTRNILINFNSQIFLCDFGLSRFFDPDEALSFGVVTQWYRAPEIILDAEYSCPSDVWSVGVILSELLLRRHLFPGKCNDSADQLNLIFKLVGTPKENVFEAGHSFEKASLNARNYALAYIKHYPSSSVLQQLLNTSKILNYTNDGHVPLAVQLAESLLRFDPAERPTADAALRHEWFEPCRAFINEMIQSQDSAPIPLFTQANSLSIEQLLEKIEEIVPIFSEELLTEETEAEEGDDATKNG